MRYFYTYDKDLPEFYVCGNLISENGFLHCRRSFDCNVLILVLEGTLFITQSEKSFEVSAGQYIFLKADEEHYGHRATEGKLSYMWVHFCSSEPLNIISSDDIPAFPEAFTYFLPEYGTCTVPQRANMLFYQISPDIRDGRFFYSTTFTTAVAACFPSVTVSFISPGSSERTTASARP